MKPLATEDTITVIIREELIKHDIKSEAFIKLQTPEGLRKPDLYCTNGGNYVIEAKLKEPDFFKVIGKIYDSYLKYYDLLDISGGFALLYPKELTKIPLEELKTKIYEVEFMGYAIFSPNDTKRNTIPIPKGNLKQVLNYIAEQILKPIEIEPDLNFIIESIRNTSKLLINGLKGITGSQFEDIFGGKNVFINILQYEERNYPEEEMRLAVSYLLLNQIIFYHILSKNDPNLFPELNTSHLKSPKQLNDYFITVLDKNYEVVFSYDVASRLPKSSLNQLIEIINIIKAISPEKIKSDLLGTIFHDLIPFNIRKMVAAFYTNIYAAELLAKLSIFKYNAKVADFACGSGGLLVGAYKRKKELFEKENRNFTFKYHENFLSEDILGVDIMPFAAHLAAMNLALQTPSYFTKHVKVAVWDSTELTPKSEIPAVAEILYVLKGQKKLDLYLSPQEKVKGTVSLKKNKKLLPIQLQKFDLILMNPPFTRQERIPDDYKDALIDRFKSYVDYIDGQMSYFNYFIFLADKFLNIGGFLAYVLPASFLRVKSSLKVRKFLSKRYNIRYIIANISGLNFSESTWKREILLIAQKKSKKSKDTENYVSIINIPKLPTNSTEVNKFYKIIIDFKNEFDKRVSEFSGFNIRLDHFINQVNNWYKFITFENPKAFTLWEKLIRNNKFLTKFEDLIERMKENERNITIKRGIETAKGMKIQFATILRDQNRAISKKDIWIVEKEITRQDKISLYLRNRINNKITLSIPKTVVMRTIRSLSNQNFMDLSNEYDYVVVKNFKNSEFFFEREPNLINVLSIWNNYVHDRIGNLIILRRFVLPAPGTNFMAFFSSKPIAPPGVSWIITGLNDDEAKIITLWFNSGLHLFQILLERIEDVWINVHEYVVIKYLIPNILNMSIKVKNKILNLYNKLSNTKFKSIYEQSLDNFKEKRVIDEYFLELFGFNNEQVNEFLDNLYPILSRKISDLSKQMNQRRKITK